MKLGDLLEKVDIVSTSIDRDTEIRGICYDSRKLKSGELFVAVRGQRNDGHSKIDEAFSNGATCVICEQAPENNVPHIVVRDSRKALATVSAAWFGYPADKVKLIGVTGTNGKTTVTSLLKRVIESCAAEKVGLIGTNVNMIGEREIEAELTTPESYQLQELLYMMVKEGCKYVVMEVSSHALQQSRVFGIEFAVGVFTNLSPEHLDFHASMEEYANAKSLLFSQSEKSAINVDDPYASLMIKKSVGPVFTYAVDNGAADLVGKSVKLQSDRIDFCALAIGSLNRVELKIPGMFSVYNALAVLSAAIILGFEAEAIIAVLQTCEGVKGRAEVVPNNRGFTVLIDYAHTPDALENIIRAVRGSAKGRVVTLFGCGGDRDRSKRHLMGSIAQQLSDYVVVTSDNPRTESPDAIISDILEGMDRSANSFSVIENRREAIHWALKHSKPGDVLILAGKGHETYQIRGKEKVFFDEREVVAEYFQKNSEFGIRNSELGNERALVEGEQ